VKRLVEWPYGRIVSELIAEAHRDPEFATVWREHFVFERRRRGREAGERAVARGEIPAGTDVELLLDLVFGSLYHRLLHGHAPLTPDVAARVVDAALDGAVESVRSA
jgi:hypothetical protein